ncbi:angiopoietin-4 [Lepus europaeus]|uniref:angiopoietin-4 n=1 Tax=Lepus europaeus TaxID=9983 RepID=UPI002B4A8324|nr:angiopoietin-4 [Lepus europaeus]
MFCRAAMLLGSLLILVATMTAAQQRWQEMSRRRLSHTIQHGQCTYTFVLPEPRPCMPEPEDFGDSNIFQKDTSAGTLPPGDWRAQRVQRLEKALENNTQWLQKLERYIQMNLRSELAQAQQHVVQNQTATMLELSTSLLNRSTAQTHKLTNVETQVLNQTLRMENQLLETSLSTNKLQKQLQLQSWELHQLQDHNSALQTRVQALETQQQAELATLRDEKEKLQSMLGRQSGALAGLERSLLAASSNSSLLQSRQRQLLELVQRMMRIVAESPASMREAEQVFQDCAEIQRGGASTSGVYTIHVANVTEPKKVFCDMETNGGGWTLIQRRDGGKEDFQRNWKDYKQGFGDPAAEHWLGNEVVHQLTSRAPYSLRVELQDWEGHEVYAEYERFQLGSEEQWYRLSVSGYNGTAGRQSSLVLQDTNFSTRDADNDNCHCKCAQMLSGGWWFDACGVSNLNGIYYPKGHHIRKLNGIRWQYFRGSSYSLRATRMMLRPASV